MAACRKRPARPSVAPLPRVPARPSVSFREAGTALLGNGARAYYADTDAVARFLAARPRLAPYPHQETGAAFMAQRMAGAGAGGDAEAVRGGFLCDDMRSGKTGTCIVFVLGDVQARVSQNPRARFGRPFLICGHKNVVDDVWVRQFDEFLEHGTLVVRVLTTDTLASAGGAVSTAALHAQLVGETDVIITTYPTLSHRHPPGSVDVAATVRALLRGLTYRAVICDEAHALRSEDTRDHQTVAALRADAKWFVSGTPVHNSSADLRSALRLVGVSAARVDAAHAASGAAGLTALAAPLTLRRRRDAATGRVTDAPAAAPPPPPLPVVSVPFATDLERRMYDYAVAAIIQRVAAGRDARRAGGPHASAHDMQAIHNMREICLSPYAVVERLRSGVIPLLPGTVLVDADEALREPHTDTAVAHRFLLADAIEGADTDVVVRAHRAHVGEAAWPAASARITALLPTVVPPVSSKERWLLNELVGRVLEARGEKAVIVSNWRHTLDRLRWLLDVRAAALRHDGCVRAPCTVIHGAMTRQQRSAARTRFASDAHCSVMLCTLTANNVGVDMSCANHMAFTDPWWNPYPELQAVHRMHGPRQTRPVHVYSLAMCNSIDEDVIYVRNEKLSLDVLVIASDGDPMLVEPASDYDGARSESALCDQVIRSMRPISTARVIENDSSSDDDYAAAADNADNDDMDISGGSIDDDTK